MHRIKAPTTFEMTGSVIVTGLMLVVVVLLVQFLWRLSKVADQQEKLKRENVARADQVVEGAERRTEPTYRTTSVTAQGTTVSCEFGVNGLSVDRRSTGGSTRPAGSGNQRSERSASGRRFLDWLGSRFPNITSNLSGTEQPVSIPERRNAI